MRKQHLALVRLLPNSARLRTSKSSEDETRATDHACLVLTLWSTENVAQRWNDAVGRFDQICKREECIAENKFTFIAAIKYMGVELTELEKNSSDVSHREVVAKTTTRI